MKNCIIPGSFDPITAGHMSIVRTCASLFDNVFVVILNNSEKKSGMFTPDERLEIANAAIEHLANEEITNVKAVLYEGLTTDAALKCGAEYVVKGVRNPVDFSYEYELSQITRRFESSLKTIFLPSDIEYAPVSSTYVRELIKYGRFDSSDFAEGTVGLIKEIYETK